MTRLFPSKNIYSVPVQKDAFDFEFKQAKHYMGGMFILTYKTPFIWNNYNKESWDWKSAFDEEPVIICQSASATEQEAARVVEKEELFINGRSQGILHRDYCLPNTDENICEWYSTARLSLASLLRSLGLLEENYLIIEKKP